ncbi:amidase [Nocardiopsis sp. MG754419]|uniref:amidase n=1 Tax=Nocardiopsis sp. MG754419 TaxID=2259865 RepID=UPI001BA9EC1A|nr:amidase [Nocardiopsis sp. MG754419]MBR8744862.1 amidase [Nocardiopsis sp. MG754419]
MTRIRELPLHRLAALVRSRDLSPVEVTEYYLARIRRLDDCSGAYISVLEESALEQARKWEKRVVSDTPDPLPALAGVPLPIKDLDTLAGAPVTFGSRLYTGLVAPADSVMVGRLRAAGAVFLGKTNTPEFGSTCHTENAIAPPTRNPWDTRLSAGGSSGGAAAAVAAGLAPAAQGSDGGGSIRIPASVCGLFGLKPTRGRISGAPDRADLFGLSTAGPITRTVLDAALLLDVMTVGLPGDAYAAPPPEPGTTFADHARREPGRLRVGRFADTGSTGIPVHPDVLEAYERATRLLLDLGHEVEEVRTPVDAHFGGAYARDFQYLWEAVSAATPVDPAREHELTPINRWLRERARATSAPDLVTAWARLQRGVRSLLTATEPYDAVLSPTLALPPVPVGHFTGDGPETEFRRMTEFTPFTSVYNVSGQPSVNVPLHWSPAGVPIGVMLTGRTGGEGTLLSLSAQLEQARPWAHRVPPGWED